MDTPSVPTEVAKSAAPFRPLVNALDSSFTDKALREIDPLMGNITSIKRDGNKVAIARDKVQAIPLNSNFLNDNIKVNSIDLGRDVAFEVDLKNRTASNITGVSINLTLFGSPYGMDITKVRLGQDANGQKTLFTELKNPLPEPGQRIVGMPPSFSVEIPVTPDGKLQAPLLSKVFADASASTGPSIAGLLSADALNEASKVALFVESNPKWVNNVVEPALEDVLRHLVTRPAHNPVQQAELPRPVQPVPMQAGPPVNFVKVNATDASKQPKDQTTPKAVAPQDITKPGDYDLNMTVEGAERNYHMHVPPSYNGQTPMPMVILLHGHAQNGKIIAEHTKFNQMADREGFIAIYPDARTWAGREEWRAWDTDNGLLPPGSHANDVSFLRQMIESTESTHKIDPKRIYMAGLSNGGMLSFRAAGDLSDKIAAIAVVSGAMSGREPSPKSPISVLNIHGTEDGIIPFEGLKNVPPSLTAIGLPRFKPTTYATDYWVEQNKITNPPLVINNKNVIERRFINTDSGAEVEEYTIIGGRHVPDNIDEVTGHIWKFFASHPKATGTTSGTQQPAEEPYNLTKRLESHIQKRGFNGIQLDAAQMLGEVKYLGDGSISPANTINQFEKQSGVQLSDTISKFLKSTNSVSKLQNRIQIEMASPQQIPINSGNGGVEVKSVQVENTSFNLMTEKGKTSLTDISGLSFNVNALGRDMNVPVHEITQKIDMKGAPYYRLKAQNPMGGFSRAMMLADKEIPIDLRLTEQGDAYLTNQREVKDATLGVNPITRGYIDIGTHGHRLFTNPSLASGANFTKDIGIMAGMGYGAYKFSPMKWGTKGRVGAAVTVGLIVAPAVIHGIERLVGD